MTNQSTKLSFRQLSTNISAHLKAIASQRQKGTVERIVSKIEQQMPDTQIVVSETSSRSLIDIITDENNQSSFVPTDGFDEPSVATAVANIVERSQRQ